MFISSVVHGHNILIDSFKSWNVWDFVVYGKVLSYEILTVKQKDWTFCTFFVAADNV